MRNISFFLTTEQVRQQAKTVTRRLGWTWLVEATRKGSKPLLQPVVKGQGLKRGQKVQLIGAPIRILSASMEPLHFMEHRPKSECEKEGFWSLTPMEFIQMFCEHNHCDPSTLVTRIEFEYTVPRLCFLTAAAPFTKQP